METNELLLCGSGVLAFAHIGVLKALEEHNVKIGKITGTSTGSLIATLSANGVSSSGIQDLFLNRDKQGFNSAAWLGTQDGCNINRPRYCPVVDLLPIAEDFVREHGLKPVKGLRIVAFDVLTGKPCVFEGTQYDLALALASACAVPGISRPVRTGTQLLMDISTQDWKPEALCSKGAMISRAVFDGEDAAILTQLDKWLRRRRLVLHVCECPLANCAERTVIETKLSESDRACACSQDTAAYQAVIDAGCSAARAKLSELTKES